MTSGWVEKYVFDIKMLPVSKGRPRVTKKGFCYTPAKTKKAEQDIATTISEKVDEVLLGPIRLEFTALLPRPKAHFGTGKNAGKLKDSAPHLHTKRPDLDNLEKLFCDAANGVVYKDDSQVCQKMSEKCYGEIPGYYVKVFEWVE